MSRTFLGALFKGDWDDYHKNGIIPNIWAGITGQKSAEMQTEASLKQSDEQFNSQQNMLDDQFKTNQEFLEKQHSEQMDFANRQLADNTNIANQNLALQREAYEYQKQLNATQMEREDSAIQRQIKDYEAAGFSPLAAIGGNGAGSASLSSGAAPQYDISGINAAAGQYADFARQYSDLHMAASQNYMNNKSQLAQKHNSDVLGARMALSQMRSDMHYKGLNAATQIFNSSVNARHTKLTNEYLQEQKDYLSDKHSWEEMHGYRDSSIAAAISNFATKLADKYDLGEKTEKLIDDALTQIKQGTYETTKQVVEKSIEVAETIGKTEKLAKSEINKLTLSIILQGIKYAQDHVVK